MDVSDTPHIRLLAEETGVTEAQVQAVVQLLDDGASVPFIARYRKEATGSLDEVAITGIRDRMQQLRELEARKAAILSSLETNGHLTEELEQKVRAAESMAILEDIYLPYRPKRRTRAMMAREKGLEPLAQAIFKQEGIHPEQAAMAFVDEENQVPDVETALSGARDIMAEWMAEDEKVRAEMRQLFFSRSIIRSRVITGKETEGAKYRDYFEWEEPAATAPSHRILAMRRGEREEILSLTIEPPDEEAMAILIRRFITGQGDDTDQVELAMKDAYRRLLSRSMETETRLMLKDRADAEAIRVFSENLRQLLMAPPLGAKRVMGIDPGFRTGCKVVCLDRQGKLLHYDTIFPHTSETTADKARTQVSRLCEQFSVEAIAVGNGTAGRETELFVKSIAFARPIPVIMVNESGASIYSASEVAREEFPDLDLTVRGAVSIGRRLMDPLAELVKIDPKSIGVGQYQHDVDQTALKQSLDDVVISCVNGVGVDLNRASAQLLTYVSGVGPGLAKNIVAHRDAHGPFTSRKQLLDVKRLGPKAFEQCAGFLRIPDGDNPLDASAVHPETYPVVETMATDLGCQVADLIQNPQLRNQIDIHRYVTDTVGIPTLEDIMAELAKPGRDPRENFESFSFSQDVQSISDLKEGMTLPGIVTNITAFGAFVDIGVHQDGLVHISEMADRFVSDPADVVKVHQKVQVTVISVDLERNRIGLSMKSQPGQAPSKSSQGSKKSKKSRQPVRTKSRGNGGAKPFNNPFADLFGGN